MTNRVNNKKNLPKSFHLEKYDALSEMSDKDLFRQLYWRQDDLDVISKEYPDYGMTFGSEYPMNNNLGDPFDEIEPEEWFKLGQKPYTYKSMPLLVEMSSGEGIRPTMRYDVSMINKICADKGYWKGKPIIVGDEDVGELFTDDNGLFWSIMREPVSLLSELGEVYVNIDLQYRNEILIQSFSELLNKWRLEFGKPEPEKPVAGNWESVRRKILEYKLIPLIDLLSWEKATDSKISLGVLMVSLFPDGDKDQFMIAQTIKPYLDKIMRNDSLDKILRELSKDNR